MHSLRKHLSYANVVATLALVFAMSGGALAASHYLINSTKQISPSVLKALKVQGVRGLTGAPGETGSQGATGPAGPSGGAGPKGDTGSPGVQGEQGLPGLEGKQGEPGVKGEQGQPGLKGEQGEPGVKGEQGAPGISAYQVVEGEFKNGSLTGINLASSTATCPAGTEVLGGGFGTSGNDQLVGVADEGPNGTSAWEVRTTSATTETYGLEAVAICANVSS